MSVVSIFAATILLGVGMGGDNSLMALVDFLISAKSIGLCDIEKKLSIKLDPVESDEYYSIFEKDISSSNKEIRVIEYRLASKIADTGDISNIFPLGCVLEKDILKRYSLVRGRENITSSGVSRYFFRKTGWGKINFDFSGADTACLKSITVEVKKGSR
jgi:hypothetical protein